MKCVVRITAFLALAVILCLALTGCKACSATPSIIYNKKYRHGDDFIVFHADKTGYFEKHYWYTNATCSMRINFYLEGRRRRIGLPVQNRGDLL